MLDKLYSITTPWAISNKRELIKNRIIGRMANYIYPIYCKTFSINKNLKKEDEVIVSLTSFPARIEKVYLCINSILRQTKPAGKVILWLAKTQFESKDELPKNLLELEKYGLEIRFCEDLKSYKKVFFTAQEYLDKIIITADDDTLYPEYWIEKLLDTYYKYSNCVCCYRAHKISFSENGEINPYKNWIGLSPYEKGPSMLLVPIGVGGVLYPPRYFENIDFNFNIIKEICPTTDDLWLKVVGLTKGYKAVKVDENSKEWYTLKSSQKDSLMKSNVGESINDTSLKNLFKYYDFDINVLKED